MIGLFEFLPPATKLRQGNVFHPSVSHSVHGGVSASSPGGCLPHIHPGQTPRQTPPWADTPLGRHPPGQTPPWADIPQEDTPCPVHAGIHTPLPSACWDTPPLHSACWDTPPCTVHAGIWSTSRR